MTSIEISLGNQKFVIRSEESEEHLKEVAELVRRKVESIRRQSPTISVQKAVMLAAFDFASRTIKGRRKALDYRASVVDKAECILKRIEGELSRSAE